MTEVRRISICEEFKILSPDRTIMPGDMLELRRDALEKTLDVVLVTREGGRIPLRFEDAELMFRNGVLGKPPRHLTDTQFSLLAAVAVFLFFIATCYAIPRFELLPIHMRSDFSLPRDSVAALVMAVVIFAVMRFMRWKYPEKVPDG